MFQRLLLIASSQQLVRNIASTAVRPNKLVNRANPYLRVSMDREDSDAVFITGRFRSGSTMLWNVFRNLEGCTAYYEPFNERKWFSDGQRGLHTDPTHLGVNDYWAEYRKLGFLDQFFDDSWGRHKLYMDETSWNQRMEDYIQAIIDAAPDKPVLQFNRVDFRLPWLKQRFPRAKIIHIYRHPRDQWFSFLTDKKLMNKDDVASTYRDSFYLNAWSSDLQTQFPFLGLEESPHPYVRFYYLWKLSYLYGLEYSDVSVSFESVVENPEKIISEVLNAIDWPGRDVTAACRIVEKPALDKWKKYADEDWFTEKESYCESVLSRFFNSPGAE